MKYISFIVPCFNSQEYLCRCIDSLLLDERRAEIIIVDDGSTDRTGEIADEYVVAHAIKIQVGKYPDPKGVPAGERRGSVRHTDGAAGF